MRRWRSSGLKIVLYIDDGICIADSKSHAKRNTAAVTQDLHQAGFILNSKIEVNSDSTDVWLLAWCKHRSSRRSLFHSRRESSKAQDKTEADPLGAFPVEPKCH